MECPWNNKSKLLSIAIQTKPMDTSQLPKSNFVFLIDVSGSMDSEDKLPLLTKAFKLLSEQFTEDDRISIVTYAGSDEVILATDGDLNVGITSEAALKNLIEEQRESGVYLSVLGNSK